MILGLIWGIVWFIVFLVGHIAIARFGRQAAKRIWSSRLLLAGVVCIVFSVVLPTSLGTSDDVHHGGWWMGVVWGELTYLSLFCVYMPFYYMVAASLSLRTMVMLRPQPNQKLALKLLQEEFGSASLVNQRLTTMADNGFLLRDDNHYVLTLKGRLVARTFAWLKRFWNLGSGG